MKPRQPVDRRLRDLAYEVLEPYSQSFLRQSGLTEGMRVLEIGCGAGSMTPWISRKVGPTGRLVALDINPQEVECARQKVMESGIDNTDFISTSVENILTIGRDFDFIYGRFILMQLHNPFEVLERLISCLHPGGVIALDEPNQEADFANPACPPCERANRLFLEYADCLKLNFRIGDSLYPMLLRSGVQIKVAHSCQPIFPLHLAIQMFKHGLLDSLSTLLQANITDELSIETILDELEQWPVNDADFYVLSRQVQVSGVKI
jgi:ubiquinone/menaquinone biosynthesis C-methylase UbiE